ncbi:MAG: LysR substrate-binding domain-containing protein, partial [Pseudomonadota bacterium]
AERIVKAADLENALRAEPFVAYDMDKPLIRDWCQMNNLDIGGELPAMTAPDIRLLRAFVVAGIGWSVIPDYLCEKSIKSGALQLISAPQSAPSNAFYLVWVKSALRHPRVAFTRDILINAW